MSESRVRIDDETEQAPVTDGEVGEADVFGEPEEPGTAGEAGDGVAGQAVADEGSLDAGRGSPDSGGGSPEAGETKVARRRFFRASACFRFRFTEGFS